MFCDPGEPVELRPEPKNPVDPQAVAVFSARNFQIGYVTAERAPWIGSMIRSGREIAAVFQHPTPFGAWIRINIDGVAPTLPADPKAASHQGDQADWDPDFYPDEDPSEDYL